MYQSIMSIHQQVVQILCRKFEKYFLQMAQGVRENTRLIKVTPLGTINASAKCNHNPSC